MTLVIGMCKGEGVYLSVDHRVTDRRTGEVIDDRSIKHLAICYPPLDEGPRVLMGYTGTAELRDGTPTGTWLRETLRDSGTVNQSLLLLRSRLDRDFGRKRWPLIVNFVVVEGDRRLWGGLSNLRQVDSELRWVRNFECQVHELQRPFVFANGRSAMARSGVLEREMDRLERQLSIRPRDPSNHMGLLAAATRRVAESDPSVSPHCHVAFLPGGTWTTPMMLEYSRHSSGRPRDLSVILGGVDLGELSDTFMEWAWNGGPEPTMEYVNDRLKPRS